MLAVGHCGFSLIAHPTGYFSEINQAKTIIDENQFLSRFERARLLWHLLELQFAIQAFSMFLYVFEILCLKIHFAGYLSNYFSQKLSLQIIVQKLRQVIRSTRFIAVKPFFVYLRNFLNRSTNSIFNRLILFIQVQVNLS